jgi:hypothetical protein
MQAEARRIGTALQGDVENELTFMAAAWVGGKTLNAASDAWDALRRSPKPALGVGAASRFDEVFAMNRHYVASPKHPTTSRVVAGRKVSAAPTSGQAALDTSFQVSPNSPRRVGIDASSNEIVVFDRTGNLVEQGKVVGGQYHGHVRTWDELTSEMQNVLKRNGVSVVGDGRLQLDPKKWGN